MGEIIEIQKNIKELQSKNAEAPIGREELSRKLKEIDNSLSDLTEGISNDIDMSSGYPATH